jgi:hypothetical protein
LFILVGLKVPLYVVIIFALIAAIGWPISWAAHEDYLPTPPTFHTEDFDEEKMKEKEEQESCRRFDEYE